MELLVVLGIIVLLMGLVLRSTKPDQRDAAVRAAAMELAATMRSVHELAITQRQTYAIVFNIQNEPGSSGAVLNNRSGGHWYRILGPAKNTQHGTILNHDVRAEFLPWACSTACRHGSNGLFGDFIEDVSQSWHSQPIPLPAGKVRFLALGDTDEGTRWRTVVTSQQGYYPPTYPRPWFGYFDPAAKKLWSWGGYDPAIPGSGFYYQGLNEALPANDTPAESPPVVGCRNPATRTIDVDWDPPTPPTGWAIADVDRNGDGDTTDRYEQEVGIPVWKIGEPRPLVDANWLDATLIFLPNGSVTYGEWNRGRRAYQAGSSGNRGLLNWWGGVPERAKVRRDGSWGTPSTGPFTSYLGWCDYDFGEVCHFTTPTGGWRITLAPDVADDRTDFPDAASALATMLPAWRVSVNGSGLINAERVQNRPGYLDSLPPADAVWPPAPGDWQDSAKINANCRLGYWHEQMPASWYYGDPLTPKGHPISRIVDPAMLTRRVWWKTLP